MGWRIEFEGEVYQEGDLTLGQCERIEESIGKTWALINPIASAKQARAVLEVCAADRTGQSVEEIRRRVEALKVDEFLKGFNATDDDDRPTEYVDGNPPVADGPLTPG